MLYHWENHTSELSDVISSDLAATEKAIAELLSRPSTLEKGMFTWFDQEIKATLGVDVMAESFDRERGYGLYHGPRAAVLVLKLEHLADLLSTVVSEFVGVSLSETRANVRRQEKRGEEYVRLKKALCLPEHVCDRIYSHAWVRHFYGEEEIAAFRARWT
jgi:hypothetical protein